jgi:hypothetical protein
VKTYVLRDRDGDFVQRVESRRTETIKVHFLFTKDRSKARQFTTPELEAPIGSSSLLQEFLHGFAGGRMLRNS